MQASDGLPWIGYLLHCCLCRAVEAVEVSLNGSVHFDQLPNIIGCLLFFIEHCTPDRKSVCLTKEDTRKQKLCMYVMYECKRRKQEIETRVEAADHFQEVSVVHSKLSCIFRH